jgi:hypothetical protein
MVKISDTMRMPENTKDTLYIAEYENLSLMELLTKIREYWPDESFDNLDIQGEHIQVDCFGYDLYDSSDYMNFIVVTKKAEKSNG